MNEKQLARTGRPNVVITGASSGIGAALACRYARDAGVLGLIGRDRARLEETAERCRANGGEARTALIDVRDRAALAAWLEEFDRSFPVDIVIANAGVTTGTLPDGALEQSDAAHALMQTNVLGVLNTIHPLIPRMLERGRGQIVLMSSIGALFPLPDSGAYCASKAAILTYGLALRGHLYDAGVRVTVICPGYVTSPMSERIKTWKPLEISAEAAADRIVEGLHDDRAVVTFPWLLALAARCGAALPDALRRWAIRPFRFHVTRGPSNT
jgi:short-subunit dehydrogenase